MRYKVAIMLFKSASDGETIGGETMSLRRKKTVACPKCNKESDYLFWESLNGDLDPEAKTQLIDGTFFQFKCPHCGHECKVDYGMLYHDMAHQTMIYYVSENSVEEIQKMFSDKDGESGFLIPGYRKRIVTNQNALREKAIIFENELDDRVVELIKLLYLLDVQDKFPEVNIVEAYFLVLEGKYIIEFIGEKFLKTEIPLDLYKNVENNFAERLAAEEENQFMIDVKWANEFLKK